MSMTLRQKSGVVSMNGMPRSQPALLTRIVASPSDFTTASGRAATALRSVTSTAKAADRPPLALISSVVAFAVSPLRSTVATAAPWVASWRAMAFPMPDPAPVTTAVLPVRSITCLSLIVARCS